MKCGICQKTAWTPQQTGISYRRRTIPESERRERPIYDRGDLEAHKKQDHPEEYQAALKKRQQGRRDKEALERNRRAEEREAVDRHGRIAIDYISGWGRRPDEYELVNVATAGNLYRIRDMRYPTERDMAEIESIQRQISELQERLNIFLPIAYQNGTEVPESDWQELRDKIQADVDAVTL